MSTNDVPGANVAHFDTLAAGCWAEHDDGSRYASLIAPPKALDISNEYVNGV